MVKDLEPKKGTDKMIITAAVTGGELASKQVTPYVPCSVGDADDPNPLIREYVKRIGESEASDKIVHIAKELGREVATTDKLGKYFT